MNNPNKICSTCGKEKFIEEFGIMKTNPDGYRNTCKDCRKNFYYSNHEKMLREKKEHYLQNKEMYQKSQKKYYEQNKEEIKQQSNEYYHKNKDNPDFYNKINRSLINQKKKERRQKHSILREQQKIQEMIDLEACSPLEKQCSNCKIIKTIYEFNKMNNVLLGRKTICRECQKQYKNKYYEENRETLLQKDREFKKNNPEKVKEQARKYYSSDHGKKVRYDYKQREQVKIANRLRAALRKTVKEYDANKSQPSLNYLGCSIDNFIIYLKSQLKDNMTWEKVLDGSIHLDHFLPLCALDLTKEENLYKVCNYKNIQLLWAKDNLSKCAQDKLLSIH